MNTNPDVSIIDAGGDYHLGLRDDQSGQGYERLFSLSQLDAYSLLDAGYKRVRNGVAAPIVLSEGDPDMPALIDLHQDRRYPQTWFVIGAGMGVLGEVNAMVAERMSKAPHVGFPDGMPEAWRVEADEDDTPQM